jgi:hypothetical protein
MADINADPRLFHRGGTFEIVHGGTTYNLKCIEPGTLEVMPGMQNTMEWVDQQDAKFPKLGDENYSEIAVTLKCGTKTGTGAYELLRNQANASNADEPRKFTVTAKIPTPASPTTGEQVTDANCFVVPGSLRYRSTPQFDYLEVRFRTPTHDLAFTTY